MTGKGLILDSVALTLSGNALFPPLSLTVAPGTAATIMGPSGSGKSSLLSALCGTLSPAFGLSGQASLDGEPLFDRSAEDRRVGILFQDDLLFPHLTVADNLAFGLPSGLARAEKADRIEQALSDADMEGYGNRDPGTLSGGQRARIACMRALLAEPRALLLDEPFSKLDAELRGRFRGFVVDHAMQRQIPLLLVTHDPQDAAAMGGVTTNLE